MIKKLSVVLMSTFYFFAGLNHFMRPENYKKMIPPYLPFHSLINYSSGFIEIFLAICIIIPATRNIASKAIILMLILFLPVHFYMLKTGWCIENKCLPEWVIWIRLLFIQPILIFWAWTLKRNNAFKHF